MDTFSLQIVKNNKFSDIHYIIKEDEPWFLAKDISSILGYSQSSKMVQLLDKRDVDKINPLDLKAIDIASPSEPSSKLDDGSIHKFTSKPLTIINESGLYDAIFNSHKPNAKEFRRWVTSEVLPSIRKTGGYNTKKNGSPIAWENDPIILIRKNQLELQYRQEQLEREQNQIKSDINQLNTKTESIFKLETEVHNLASKAEASLESIQYYSVASYARAIGYIIKDLEEAKKIGKACVRQSNKMGIPLGNKVLQGSFKVNTYHLKVIKSVFDKLEKEREQDNLPLFDSLEDREFWKVN